MTLHKNGHTSNPSRKARWVCYSERDESGSGSKRKVCYTTTSPDTPARTQSGRIKKQIVFRRTKGATNVFVVTCAQNATPRHKYFYAALEQYCNYRNGQLFVIPTRYKNPTSRWTKSQENADTWDVPDAHLLNTRLKLNKNLEVLGDIKTQPTATEPLTGFEAITAGETGILGHTKLQLRTIAAPQGRLPKILTTTGACTVPNYTDSKAGKLGEFHHTLGAAVVEIRGGVFHLRQINADKKTGAFQDLETLYGTAPLPEKGPRPLGLVMGDTHVRAVDPDVEHATFNEMVPLLDPQTLVWHDLCDGYAFNHHTERNPFVPIERTAVDMASVKEEVDKALEYVAERSHGRCSVIVPSNHNDFLQRWVAESDWRKLDPVNRVFYLRTALALAEQANCGDGYKAERLNAFIYWAKQRFNAFPKIKVLEYDESFMLGNVEVGMHGHQGPNGSRGTLRNIRRIGVKSVTGHEHSPGIQEGAYRVGTSSRLRVGYNTGPSGWLHTHCLVYANFKRTLINIINGEWRL